MREMKPEPMTAMNDRRLPRMLAHVYWVLDVADIDPDEREGLRNDLAVVFAKAQQHISSGHPAI